MGVVGYFDYDKASGVGSFAFAKEAEGGDIVGALSDVAKTLLRGKLKCQLDDGTYQSVSIDLGDAQLLVAPLGGENFERDGRYKGIEISVLYSRRQIPSYVLCAICYDVAAEAQGLGIINDPLSHVTR